MSSGPLLHLMHTMAHSSLEKSSNWVNMDGLLLLATTLVFSPLHRFSIGLRSGPLTWPFHYMDIIVLEPLLHYHGGMLWCTVLPGTSNLEPSWKFSAYTFTSFIEDLDIILIFMIPGIMMKFPVPLAEKQLRSIRMTKSCYFDSGEL